MKSLNEFIGIPFKDGGRDFDGCDCWGLVMLYYKKQLELDLPDYKIGAFDFPKISETVRAEINKPVWIMQTFPEPNAIAVMKLGDTKDVNHAAICVGEDKLLQAYDKTGSHLVNANSPLWKPLIKFYVLPFKELSK